MRVLLSDADNKEVEEEANLHHRPRERDIPSWNECFHKDPYGPLHMGSAMLMFIVALLLQWSTTSQKRKAMIQGALKVRKPRFLNQAFGRADVDAEASDSEDEATPEAGSIQSSMKLGPGMRFIDEDLEEEWEKESYPRNQQRGAVLLALVAFGLAVDRFYAFFELETCPGDEWWLQRSLQIGSILVLGKVFALLFAVPAVEGSRDSIRTFFLPSMFWDSAYWTILGFFAFFFIAVNLSPFSPSCDILSVMAKVCHDQPALVLANAKLDCTLQGHTACQMMQLWMLIMPYALPQFRNWHLTFIWLGFLYVGVSWLYAEITLEKTHMADLPLHLAMLAVTAVLGTMKKYYLEKGMRRQFLEDNLQRKALERLYLVFDGMVPKYVIPRVLMQKPICDYRQRVSILFVLIHDFHVSDANAALTFLNKYFGKMDDICAAHKVTKIETVAEEYVACVGVVEEDLPPEGCDPETAVAQHQSLLQRLFSAAYEIQQLQQDAEKKFKMGIHTGEIRAGVIGQKLPRFRLFGDTINTSARMMQKAAPGQLLFGEPTNKILPPSLKVKEEDGIIVKMKGKGDVKAFVYDESNFPASTGPLQDPASPAKPKEVEVKQEVSKAIRLSEEAAEQPKILPFILSEKVDFKSHDPMKEPQFSEEKFQMWFHLIFVRKFRLRLHRQLLLMAFMTVLDVMHMEHTEAWEKEDRNSGILPKHPTRRFTILLLCRFSCLSIGVGWSFFARTEAFREKVQQVQWGLVASTLVVATLMYISYDALIYPQLSKSHKNMHFLDYVNQQQSLVFVLAYFIVTNTHPTLFYQSLTYIPLGLVFMAIRDRTSLYISNIGPVIFLCTVVISCLLAHVLEQTSRARFKAKQRVEETQDRVETVLSNLMPKKVLEEIKMSPGLGKSHSYDHATIAQSDLCGFTQLASDKTPEEVVNFVEDLFGRFDCLTDDYFIYKVETVGDAYIAGMAEHTLTSVNSPIKVVQFGMAMIQATAEWAESRGVKVTCRVGVHHGHCVGGVVGKGMQRYHLFGSFMSELDTLEATSREGVTQISRACKDAIVREHLERLGEKATLTDGAALEKLQKEFEGAVERTDIKLTTSKGEEHDYNEVGGRTYLIYKDRISARS